MLDSTSNDRKEHLGYSNEELKYQLLASVSTISSKHSLNTFRHGGNHITSKEVVMEQIGPRTLHSSSESLQMCGLTWCYKD